MKKCGLASTRSHSTLSSRPWKGRPSLMPSPPEARSASLCHRVVVAPRLLLLVQPPPLLQSQRRRRRRKSQRTSIWAVSSVTTTITEHSTSSLPPLAEQLERFNIQTTLFGRHILIQDRDRMHNGCSCSDSERDYAHISKQSFD